MMSIERDVTKRAENRCELCKSEEPLALYEVPNSPTEGVEATVLVCQRCSSQFDSEERDINHWRCLNDSMWSTVPAVQVMAWRMLHRIKAAGWPQDLLDMIYMDEELLRWAAAAGDAQDTSNTIVHRDVNGAILEAGDSVVLIKDLKVKGSSMVAKQGTAVRRISLDQDNEKYIEGKVDGQQIVLVTDYVKKM